MSIEVVEKCLKKRCNETGVFCKKCNLEGVLCSDGDILCPKCFKKLGKGSKNSFYMAGKAYPCCYYYYISSGCSFPFLPWKIHHLIKNLKPSFGWLFCLQKLKQPSVEGCFFNILHIL